MSRMVPGMRGAPAVDGFPGMPRAKMTAAAFDRARPRLRQFTDTSLKIARAVLVGGLGPSAAAFRFHTSRQRVHGIVRRVQGAIEKVPDHWKRVEVWLPPKLAERVKRMARQALADWRKAAREGRRSGARPQHGRRNRVRQR